MCLHIPYKLQIANKKKIRMKVWEPFLQYIHFIQNQNKSIFN